MKQKAIAVLLVLVICAVTIWIINYQYRFFIDAAGPGGITSFPTFSTSQTTTSQPVTTTTSSPAQTQDISIPDQPTQSESTTVTTTSQASQDENEQEEEQEENFGSATIQTQESDNQTTTTTKAKTTSETKDAETTTNNTTTGEVTKEIDAAKSEVVIDRNSALANGKDKITITITLKDQNGKAIKDQLPKIEISGQNNKLSEIKQEEDSFIATLSSTTAQEKTIKVKFDDKEIAEIKATFMETDAEVSTTAKTLTVSEEPEIAWWFSAWWFWLGTISAIILLLIVVLSVRKRLHQKTDNNNEENSTSI